MIEVGNGTCCCDAGNSALGVPSLVVVGVSFVLVRVTLEDGGGASEVVAAAVPSVFDKVL